MAVVELGHMAQLFADLGHAQRSDAAAQLAADIDRGIQQYGVVRTRAGETVYAYEVDGYESNYLMDDANVPSLLSLPFLGYVAVNDSVYVRTRQLVWSKRNPYFFEGSAGAGIGGPHNGFGYIWPMSIIVRALTSQSDAEIVDCLHMLRDTTAGTDFVHESFAQDSAADFTRPWVRCGVMAT